MRIVLASANKGKLREIQQVLEPLHWELLPQSDFFAEEAEETGASFIENAIIKARHAARLSGLSALADDSGLEVDALKGEPGIYSARFAGIGASDTDNNQKLLAKMQHIPQRERTARFHCLMVYIRHATDPTPVVAHGIWQGYILNQPQGDNGFGYDPLFFSPEHGCASAELSSEMKNKTSHRAKALQQLIKLISDLSATS